MNQRERILFPCLVLLLVLKGPSFALQNNQSADVVVGHGYFTQNVSNDSNPGPNTLQNPYSVYIDTTSGKCFIADFSNNRVLIYNSIPTANNASADVVVGQANMTSNGINQGGTVAANTLMNPTNVYTDGTKLYIADYNNHRVLIYNSIPTADNASADVVVGQANMTSNTGNQGIPVAANTFYNPRSVYTDGTKLYIADTFNNRVLIYNSIPTANNASANVVVGQANMTSNSSNPGGVAANTLYWPYSVYTDGTKLYIADYNNNRTLIYNSIPTANNASANVVVGQANMTSNGINQGGTVAANTLSNPTNVYTDGTKLYIADTFNNRVLIYNSIPTANNASANVVVGQANMTSNGINQGGTVAANTLKTPRSVYTDGTKLYIADADNHRVLTYNSIPSANNASANVVAGQENMTSNSANQGGVAADTLNWPRFIYTDGTKLYVADTSNHRVLIYNSIPTANNASANVVVGQANMTSNGINQGGTVAANTLNSPASVYTDGTKLYIADYSNHRVLIYNSIPTANNTSANVVVGQANMTSGSANQGGASPASNTLNNPESVYTDGTKLYIADYSNHRVLIYNSIPTADNTSANVVVGQANMTSNGVNQGGTVAANTLYYPTDVYTDGAKLYIADRSNHRVLIYNSVPTANNTSANIVVGQANMTSNSANQGGTVAANTSSNPTSVYTDGTKLYVADFGNNRVLIHNNVPTANNASADVVIGQANMTSNGINQGGTVAANTLKNPFRVYINGTKLYVADYGNHRALIYYGDGDSTPPSAISNLTALSGTAEGTVKLTWTAPGNDGETGTAQGYLVRYATFQITTSNFYDANVSTYTDASSWTPLTGGSAEGVGGSRVVSGLTGEATYYFSIKAYDTGNNYGSWNTGTDADGINDSNFIWIPGTPPAAVTTLSGAAGTGAGEINLTWTAPGDDGTTGNITNGQFRIKYSSNSADTWTGMPYEIIKTTSMAVLSSQSYVVTGLIEGGTYYLYIKHADSASNWSDISNKTTSYAQSVPPAAITNLSALSGTNLGDISLTWTAPREDGASGGAVASYDLRIATANFTDADWNASWVHQVSGEPNPSSSGLTESTTIQNLNPGTNYYFRIKSNDDVNNISDIDTTSPQAWSVAATLPGSLVMRPVAKDSGDTTGETVVGNIADANDSTHWVLDSGETIIVDSFTVVSSNIKQQPITQATLVFRYSTDSGYDQVAGSKVKISTNEVTETNTDIDINDTGGSAAIVSTSTVLSISSWTALENLDVKYASEDSGAPDDAYVKDIWLNIVYSTSDASAPNAITNLTALTGSNPNEINLSWSAPGDDGTEGNNSAVAYYTVRYATYGVTGSTETWWDNVSTYTQNWVVQNQGVTENKVLIMPEANKQYWIAMKTIDESGNTSVIDGSVSPVFCVSAAQGGLSAPVIGSITNVYTSSITANWGLVSTATGYTLAASTESANPPVTIWASSTTVGVDSTTATVYTPSLDANTTYYLFVRANGDGQSSSYSTYPVTATLAALVTNPQVYAVYQTSVTVTWTPVGTGEAQSYVLEASTASNFSPVARSSSTTNITLSTLTVTGLNGGTTYYFRVGSVNHNSVANYAVDGSTYIAPVYSINVIELSYDFGSISLGVSTISATAVNVDNNGNMTQTFSIRATTTTSGSPWFISADGVVDSFNEVALRAVFHTSAPLDADFNPGTTEDLVTESYQASQATLRYTVGGSTTGVNVPAGQSRQIWFRLSAPAVSSTADSQTFRVYIRGD